MTKQEYKKVTFDFPADEYVYLKMACAKQGVSMKLFLTKAIIKTIEEYENELDLKALKQITEDDRKIAQPWEDVKKELGWDKL